MCPGFDQSLRPRCSRSRRSKSWEAAAGNPFSGVGGGHGGDSEEQDENLGDEEEEEEESGGGGDLDDDREGELADVLGRCSRRHGSSYFYDRQLYLHSYQFRRKLSVCDRLRGSLKRIKAAAWSLVSCKYGDQRHQHRHSARKFCKRLSGAVSSLSLKPRCVQLPD